MKRLLLLICIGACALAVCAQMPTDVPKGHWAYSAVVDLANKGYVSGYPDGKFLGSRELSRYEFATIVKRVVDGLDERMAKAQGSAVATEPTAIAAVTQTATAAGVSPDDLATISKLVDEFKVELTVIGTRLDKVEADLADVKSKVDNMNAIVTDPEGAVEATRSDVSKLKKVAVSGYTQIRYQMLQNPEDKFATHTDDTFFVRRARLKVAAKPTDKTMAVLQIDAGQNKFVDKEAYVQYNLATDPLLGPSFTVGQQIWQFGYDVTNSSSKRETPEEALFCRRFFPGEYDRGAVASTPVGKNWFATIGVYDGSGADTVNQLIVDGNLKTQKIPSNVAKDYNDKKDVLANLRYSGPNMEGGVSGYVGKGIWDPNRDAMDTNTDKVRYGADFRYYWDNFNFKAEYIRGKGIDQTDPTKFNVNQWVDGYYGQVDYNVTRQDELVARYESMSQDPLNPAFGQRTAWNLGYIRFLDDSQKFKLFYQINKEQKSEIANNAFIAEWLVTY